MGKRPPNTAFYQIGEEIERMASQTGVTAELRDLSIPSSWAEFLESHAVEFVRSGLVSSKPKAGK